MDIGWFLTIKEWKRVRADGIQGDHVFAIFGAAAFVLLFPAEERSSRGCGDRLAGAGLVLQFRHTVPAVKFLVHPVERYCAQLHVNNNKCVPTETHSIMLLFLIYKPKHNQYAQWK